MDARRGRAPARTKLGSIATRAVLLAIVTAWFGWIGFGPCLAQLPAGTSGDSRPIVLHFPRDRSLGEFHTVDPQTHVAHKLEARGDVHTWRGHGATLTLSQEACNDLTPLPALVREGLERLSLVKVDLDAQAVEQIAASDGLDGLFVQGANLTDADFAKLARLSSLTAISISGSLITDQGVAELARLRRLKQFGLFAPGVSDQVWKSLAKCKSLKLLSLGGRLSVGSLVGLRELPPLEGLMLDLPSEITPDGLAEVGKLVSLKGLGLGRSKVRAAGLPHLGNLQQIENLQIADVKLTGDVSLPLVPLPKLAELRLPEGASDALLQRIGEFTSLQRIDCRGDISDDTMERLTTLAHLKSVNLICEKVTDRGLECLCKINSLTSLWLQGCAVTDDGLQGLASLPALDDLMLSSTKVTDDGLRHLQAIRGLRNLSLQDLTGGANGQGLRDLRELTLLESLTLGNMNFQGAPLAEAELEHLLPLRNLKKLRLNRFPVGPAGLERIAQLPALEELELSTQDVTSFDDSALEVAARMPKLTKLTIGGQFTDRGLVFLEQCGTLTDLTIASGSLGGEAIEQLKSKMRVRVIVPRAPGPAGPPAAAPPPRPNALLPPVEVPLKAPRAR